MNTLHSLLCATIAGCAAVGSAEAQAPAPATGSGQSRTLTLAAAREVSRAKLLAALLETEISVQFEQTPVRQALDYLRAVVGIGIIGRYSDDKLGFGIDPETTIDLAVSKVPAITVLELIVEQCQGQDQCTWQLRHGFVEVGTKERLSLPGAQEIRTYAIHDLLFSAPDFDNAPLLDVGAALAQAGAGGGAGGGGAGGAAPGGPRGPGGPGGGPGDRGGGDIFGPPGEAPPRPLQQEQIEDVIELITRTIEPGAWDVEGGSWATIQSVQGVLIVRAPDFIHRQLGWYR